jgi:hypothetical protein
MLVQLALLALVACTAVVATRRPASWQMVPPLKERASG